MSAVLLLLVAGILIWSIVRLFKMPGEPNHRSLKGFQGENEDFRPAGQALPYGYRKRDYYRLGFTDSDIEIWGLDQEKAPEPSAAGWVILDLLDGDLDGDIELF
jgi:hypothetical protein